MAVSQGGPIRVSPPLFRSRTTPLFADVKSANATYLGGHAIKLLGWGQESGLDYLLVTNSWGTDWGIDGYFYIELGKNMCGLADCASFPIAAKL